MCVPKARTSGTLFPCAALVTAEDEMAASGSPTVRRRRLAAELRRLRGHRTGNEVSRAIGWSPTKISRAESGHERIPPSEVGKLLDYYEVEDPLRGRLLELAEDAAQRGWWEDYADALTPQFLEFIGLEAEAVSSLQWQADTVPGLLQTEDYAGQLMTAYETVFPTTLPSMLDRILRARMLRQARLIQEPVLQLSVIIDEAVLLRRIGDRGTMHAQLERIVNVADLPNIDLRVLPLNRKIALVAGSFVIMSFGSKALTEPVSLSDVVSIEPLNTELYLDEIHTHRYRLFFDALTDASLPPVESRDLLITTMERAWS
jgi:hypothetical protein